MMVKERMKQEEGFFLSVNKKDNAVRMDAKMIPKEKKMIASAIEA